MPTERGLHGIVIYGQGLGNAMANRFSLPSNSATQNVDDYPETAVGVRNGECLVNNPLPRLIVEVFFHRLSVDDHGSTIIKIQAYLGNRALALAGGIVIPLLCLALYQGYLPTLPFGLCLRQLAPHAGDTHRHKPSIGRASVSPAYFEGAYLSLPTESPVQDAIPAHL